MNPNTHIPGATGRHVPRSVRRRRAVLVLILGLLPAGLALGAHGLLAGGAASAAPAISGLVLLLLAAILTGVRARHDPDTIRAMERRNEETFATW